MGKQGWPASRLIYLFFFAQKKWAGSHANAGVAILTFGQEFCQIRTPGQYVLSKFTKYCDFNI